MKYSCYQSIQYNLIFWKKPQYLLKSIIDDTKNSNNNDYINIDLIDVKKLNYLKQKNLTRIHYCKNPSNLRKKKSPNPVI